MSSQASTQPLATVVDQAKLDTTCVRMVGLMYPKDGLSFEEFDDYYLKFHGKLFASLPIVQKNLLKYEQVSLRSPPSRLAA